MNNIRSLLIKIRSFLFTKDAWKILIPAFLTLAGVVIGGFITAATTFLSSWMVADLQKQQLIFTQEIASLKSFSGALGFASSEIVPEIEKLNGRIGVLLRRPEIELSEAERLVQDFNSLTTKTIKWAADTGSEATVLEALTSQRSPNFTLHVLIPTLEQIQNASTRRTLLVSLRDSNIAIARRIEEINSQSSAYIDKISALIRK